MNSKLLNVYFISFGFIS